MPYSFDENGSDLLHARAKTGNIAWKVPLGKRNTGRSSGFAGPTATAGDLLFIGSTPGKRFPAIDSKTGKELWSVRLDVSGAAIHPFALP